MREKKGFRAEKGNEKPPNAGHEPRRNGKNGLQIRAKGIQSRKQPKTKDLYVETPYDMAGSNHLNDGTDCIRSNF
jgi:hypothetical protein